MKGRTPNKNEKEWMSLIVDSGCAICRTDLNVFTPAAVHHIQGKTKKGAHFLTIPLCPRHHQHKSNDGQWISRHGDGRKAFEDRYGTEREILDEVTAYIRGQLV